MSSYTNNLRLVLQVTGENPNTWGDVANSEIVQLIEDALTGLVSVDVSAADVTLTTNNGATDQARMMCIEATGAMAADHNIIVPAKTKLYLIWNNTSNAHSVTVKTAAGTGVTVTQGKVQPVFCDGTNVQAVDVKATTATDATNVTTTINGVAIANFARLDVSQAFTKSQYATPVALTDAATINTDASLSNVFKVTLGGNRTLANPTNLVDGMQITWRITQDGTGSRTLAYGTKFSFAAGVTPILTTTASKTDLLVGDYDQTADKIRCTFAANYS